MTVDEQRDGCALKVSLKEPITQTSCALGLYRPVFSDQTCPSHGIQLDAQEEVKRRGKAERGNVLGVQTLPDLQLACGSSHSALTELMALSWWLVGMMAKSV